MILNSTRKTVISNNYRLCRSILYKTRGLMFSRPKTIVFEFSTEKKIPLHMLFVFFAIDVIYLDKNNRVVELKKNFRPFSFYRPKNKASRVIETKEGAIEETNTRIGDIITFK